MLNQKPLQQAIFGAHFRESPDPEVGPLIYELAGGVRDSVSRKKAELESRRSRANSAFSELYSKEFGSLLKQTRAMIDSRTSYVAFMKGSCEWVSNTLAIISKSSLECKNRFQLEQHESTVAAVKQLRAQQVRVLELLEVPQLLDALKEARMFDEWLVVLKKSYDIMSPWTASDWNQVGLSQNLLKSIGHEMREMIDHCVSAIIHESIPDVIKSEHEPSDRIGSAAEFAKFVLDVLSETLKYAPAAIAEAVSSQSVLRRDTDHRASSLMIVIQKVLCALKSEHQDEPVDRRGKRLQNLAASIKAVFDASQPLDDIDTSSHMQARSEVLRAIFSSLHHDLEAFGEGLELTLSKFQSDPILVFTAKVGSMFNAVCSISGSLGSIGFAVVDHLFATIAGSVVRYHRGFLKTASDRYFNSQAVTGQSSSLINSATILNSSGHIDESSLRLAVQGNEQSKALYNSLVACMQLFAAIPMEAVRRSLLSELRILHEAALASPKSDERANWTFQFFVTKLEDVDVQ